MNEWVIVAIVAVAVIFGATKLPEIARNLGRSQGEFKKGLKEGAQSDDSAAAAPPPAAAPPAQTAPTEQPSESSGDAGTSA